MKKAQPLKNVLSILAIEPGLSTGARWNLYVAENDGLY